MGDTTKQLMQDILYRVREVNHVPDTVRSTLINFVVDNVTLGKVPPATAELLAGVSNIPPVFCFKTDGTSRYLTFHESVESTREGRTKAVASVMQTLRDEGIIGGWRDEDYPVGTSFYSEPFFTMERAAVPLLGVVEYGIHINGLVRNKDDPDEVLMWMARRSPTKSKYPGMMDHIVAGGQPAGLSLYENCIKECYEEAGIPEELVRKGLRSVSAISYELYSESKQTVTRAVLFNYDLWLPSDFRPRPMDGEVSEFVLWSVSQIMESMSPQCVDPIKPNCYSVIIDWLIRNGHLDPDTPGYVDVVQDLHNRDCR